MNKHTVISVIAIIAIIIPFVYSAMNIYSAEQIKFRWSPPEKFSYFELSNNGSLEFCNSSPLPVNFKSVQITPFYDGKSQGTLHIENINIDGEHSKIQKGRFVTDQFLETQHLFMEMDYQFDGGEVKVDPRKMQVVVAIDTPIIGIIPYTSIHQFGGLDFDKMMNEKNFDC